MPKSASVEEYRKSTGFECLVGYWLIRDEAKRFNELMNDEAVQPFISGSRLSKFNRVRTFFYGSLSDSISAGFGAKYGIPGNLFVISSSLDETDLERIGENTIQQRLFFEGTKLNKNTSKDGKEPVEITFTAPTKLVPQEPGESRLKTK